MPSKKHNAKLPTDLNIQAKSPREALFLQFAQAYYQEMQAVGKNASFGQALNQADHFAFQNTRELGREALELVMQDQIDDVEKKKENRTCEKCQTKKRHRGYSPKIILSSQGDIKLFRVYWECMPCQAPEHPADATVGLESKYTVGARRLAVFAGTNWSFDKSSAHLKEFCGLTISDNTIRDLCQKESSKMENWQNNDTAAHLPFVESDGEIEFQTDGTCVNTLEGWKEYRIAMFLRRMLGPDATPQEWDTRHLPRPHIAIAIAMIAEKNEFRRHWGYWLNRLRIEDTAMVSVLADGAQWIWDSSLLEFSGKAKENLDIYHALEYLAAKGDLLYGKETAESATWFETTKRDLLEGGPGVVLERVKLLQSVEQLDRRKEVLRVLANYLEYHKGRMNYRERLSEGRSIGSGQIEGACKNLIGARLKQTGARWDERRVNRMGVLCAVLYGEQWNDYWKTAV